MIILFNCQSKKKIKSTVKSNEHLKNKIEEKKNSDNGNIIKEQKAEKYLFE